MSLLDRFIDKSLLDRFNSYLTSLKRQQQEELPVAPTMTDRGRYPRAGSSRPNFAFALDRGEHKGHVVRVWVRHTHDSFDTITQTYKDGSEIIDLECSCEKSWYNSVVCCGERRHGRYESGYRSLWKAIKPLHEVGFRNSAHAMSDDKLAKVQSAFHV